MAKIVALIGFVLFMGCVLCDEFIQAMQEKMKKCTIKYGVDMNSKVYRKIACVGFCNIDQENSRSVVATMDCSKFVEANIHIEPSVRFIDSIENEQERVKAIKEREMNCADKYGVDLSSDASKKYTCTGLCALDKDNSPEDAAKCDLMANQSK